MVPPSSGLELSELGYIGRLQGTWLLRATEGQRGEKMESVQGSGNSEQEM
jgi:hypothetical protein